MVSMLVTTEEKAMEAPFGKMAGLLVIGGAAGLFVSFQ
jgi:hypothetical protein